MEQYLSDLERDQLIEVINIGAGNASTSLSKLLDKKIKVSVPELKVDAVEKIHQFLGDSQEIITAVLLTMRGDAPGVMMLLFPAPDTLTLLKYLTQQDKKNIEDLDDFDRSALREVGNILSGSVLSAFGNFLNLQMLESVPEEAIDMMGSIVDSVLAEIGQESEVVLVFKVNFNIENGVNSQMFFIFDPKSTDKILQLTKAKLA